MQRLYTSAGRLLRHRVTGVGVCTVALLTVTVGCSSTHSSRILNRTVIHRIEPGDTLNAISRRFNTSSAAIAKANRIASAESFDIGRILNIPIDEKERPKSAAIVGPTLRVGQASQHLGKLLWPLPGHPPNSLFGGRAGSYHEGIDIPAPTGTRVRAAHSGKVIYSGQTMRGYGYMVAIQSRSIMTIYGHNSKNIVKYGRKVKAGDTIALVGATGRATGPHLHFEVRIRDDRGLWVAVEPNMFFARL